MHTHDFIHQYSHEIVSRLLESMRSQPRVALWGNIEYNIKKLKITYLITALQLLHNIFCMPLIIYSVLYRCIYIITIYLTFPLLEIRSTEIPYEKRFVNS